MDFSQTKTSTLLVLWNNQKQALTTIAKTIEDGTFKTPKEKGGAPPSQAGQMNLVIALAVDNELNKRGVKH
jgi:hypothetical protein